MSDADVIFDVIYKLGFILGHYSSWRTVNQISAYI